MAQTAPPPPKRPAKRRRRPVGRFLVLGLLAGLACYAGFLVSHSTTLRTYLPLLFRHGLRQQTPAEAFPGKPVLNVLVMGRDADYSDSDQRLHTRGRSDMLMVAHIDFARHDVALLSVPRDTLAHIDGHGVTKINAAHMFGGPGLTAQTVQQNFGVGTDQYVDLDFAGFQKAIDELGGVDLTVDKRMDYDDNWGHLHIHLRPGFQHLNGEQAMGFVRFRHSDSDLVRVRRQQALLAALKVKLRSPSTFAHLPSILDTLNDHLESDLTPEQKLVLARFLQGTPRDHIRMTTLPSREKGSAVVTDWHAAAPLLQKDFGASPPTLTADAPFAGGRVPLRGERQARHRRRHAVRLADVP